MSGNSIEIKNEPSFQQIGIQQASISESPLMSTNRMIVKFQSEKDSLE